MSEWLFHTRSECQIAGIKGTFPLLFGKSRRKESDSPAPGSNPSTGFISQDFQSPILLKLILLHWSETCRAHFGLILKNLYCCPDSDYLLCDPKLYTVRKPHGDLTGSGGLRISKQNCIHSIQERT